MSYAMTGAPPVTTDCNERLPGAPVIGISDWLGVRRTHIDLFSGIGGFAAAAAANNVETKIFCEQNDDCCNFLSAAWGLPIIRDVRIFDGKRWRGSWLLTAGVPCQPASRAGKREGENDDRWLWPQTLRIIEDAEPTWVLCENPPGILDVGLDGITAEMERIGYEVQPLSIPACACDSPQDRERIWIVANRTSERHETVSPEINSRSEHPGGNPAQRTEQCGHVANGESLGVRAGLRENQSPEIWRRRLGDVLGSWQSAEWVACADGKIRRFPVGVHEMVDGVSAGLLAALGNSIVWPVASEIISAMIATEARTPNERTEAQPPEQPKP